MISIDVHTRPAMYAGAFERDAGIATLQAAFRELPRHIAKKHMKAAMRRMLRPGVPLLKAVTPVRKSRLVRQSVRDEKGRFGAGNNKMKRVRGGAMRRAVTVKTGVTGRNSDFDQFVWSVLGYKYGFESRKAIWIERGTSKTRAFRMTEQFMASFGPTAARRLAGEMGIALRKATREVAFKKNPGVGKSGFGPGRAA